MSTFALPPGNPPDYISIPEHLKSTPVDGLALPGRLRYLLRYTRIRLLGDLDGKRLSDFEGYPRCGDWTLRALRCMILHPEDLSMLRVRGRDCRPEPAIEVARAIHGLSPQDLPVSVRLEGVLRGLGIERLGQLHGLLVRMLLDRPNCGQKTLAELKTLLRRAEAGEFTLADQQLETSTPADLLGLVDDLINRLPDRDRQVLLLRFGADGDASKSARRIGIQYGLTRSAIHLAVARSLGRIHRQGSAKLRSLLTHILDPCRCEAPLSPALLATWIDRTRPLRYSLQFYVRVITKLRPELGVSRAKSA
jgi:hypothetical protein